MLARQNRLRLEAEIIRDERWRPVVCWCRRLAARVSFRRNRRADAFTQANKNWKANVGPDRYRRGMYTHFWRSAPHPGLTVFDAPDSTTTCTRVPAQHAVQALTLANDEAFFEFAQGLAARVLKECTGTDAERLRYAVRLPGARAERHRMQGAGRLPGPAVGGLSGTTEGNASNSCRPTCRKEPMSTN